MATIPTQNPVPSEAAIDLKFNAGKIDEFVTSFLLKYTDRLGRDHLTIDGMRDIIEKAIKEFGWVTIDSFEIGATLTNSSEVLRWQSNGEYYRWDGSFPKIVPSGSTPDISGGIGTGKWLSVGDATLRGQIYDHDGATKYPKLQIARWRDEGDVRGWGSGEAGFNAAMTEKFEVGGGSLYVNEDIVFTSPVQHKSCVTVMWRARAIFPLGFIAEYAYVMDGGYANPYSSSQHFTMIGRTACYGLRAEAQDYVVGVDAKAFHNTHGAGSLLENCTFVGFNKGGIVDDLTYETTMTNISLVVSNARSDDSIGLNTLATDGRFINIASAGYATGSQNERSGNTFINLHPWGNTSDLRVGVMGKMHVGIVNKENGVMSSYYSCISDTPVRRNIASPPSRTNGGVAFISDAWRSNFTDCIALCGPFEENNKTIPIITIATDCTYKGFNVSNTSKATSLYVSFESGGVLTNRIDGGVLGRHVFSGFDGAVPPSVVTKSGVSITYSTPLQIGMDISCSRIISKIAFQVTVTTGGSQFVEILVPSIFALKTGAFGFGQGLFSVFNNIVSNEGKTPYAITPVTFSDNIVRFLISFTDGSETYAKFGDITPSQNKLIIFEI
ncbi:hypothetical protein [Yersinia kristensenii]|uniref:tail fiber/spike domain-containing protein n=1 Tax=Yersinia kristensenii TaxID=28152 RepID=UPI0011A3F9B5